MPTGRRSYVVAADPAVLSSSIRKRWESFDASNKRILEDDLPKHFYVKFKVISQSILGGTCYLTLRIKEASTDLRPKFTREILMDMSSGEFMGESSKKILDICGEGIRDQMKEKGIVMRRQKKSFPSSVFDR